MIGDIPELSLSDYRLIKDVRQKSQALLYFVSDSDYVPLFREQDSYWRPPKYFAKSRTRKPRLVSRNF